ncbi:hypothetical protein OGW18_20905 [Citrobacter sp. CK184]|uniref:hypothetical protein n=1 Tax=unclassified Citrobacter TaxID=2644389 RepID=UPI002575E151|nr:MULTISPECIES: hypothetical protein [unclassified Citrobacter]MDM3030172.1 hypothetical protein [Citrobacter sp. CK185]MDM3048760.1 hypothetical protein [Citrobacter sp. CK184]
MAAPENNLHYAGNELIIHDSGDGPDQFYRYVSPNDLTNTELLNALRDVVERNGIGYIESSDTVVRVGDHVGPCKELFKKFSQHETMTIIVDGERTEVPAPLNTSTLAGFADGGYTKGGRMDTEVCGQVSLGRLLMTVRVDGRDVLVPYQEEVSLGGYVKKIPIIDESNLIEVTTLGSNIPEFVTR